MSITLNSSGLNSRVFLGSVSQASLSLPIDLPAWGADVPVGGTINVSLSVNMGPAGRNYAPHAVIVDVTATNFAGEELTDPEWDAAFHRLSYMQFSGDPDGMEYRFPERLNIKARNIIPAQRSAYAYRNPGKYTHSAFVCDLEGNFGWASATIEILEPNYPTNNIVVLAPDGDFDHAPFSLNANRVTTWAAASARLTAIGSANGDRVLYIKRGAVVVPTSSIYLQNIDVLAWGLGDKPLLDMPATETTPREAFRSVIGNLKIQNINVRGAWNPVAEMADAPGGMGANVSHMMQGSLLDATGNTTGNILVDACDGDLSHDSFFTIRVESGGVAVINECLFTNFKNYFHFGTSSEGSALAFIGNKIEQHPQAASGGLPRWFLNPEVAGHAGWYPNNAHSGSRTASCVGTLYCGNDFFTRTGWTTQTNDIYATNSPIRLNSDGLPGARAWVVNNWIENNVSAANVISGSAGMGWVAFIFEFNTITTDPTVPSCIDISGSGTTVRNNLLIAGKTGLTFNSSMSALVTLGSNTSGPTTARNEVYSNTVVDLYTTAQHAAGFAPFKVGSGLVMVEENNVYYAPNLNTPNVSSGPLVYPALVPDSLPDPRWLGVRKSYEYWPDHYTLPANVAQGQSFTMPYRADRLGIMTNQALFAGEWDKHVIRLGAGDSYVQSVPDQMTVVFGAGGITITNNTTTTWTSGTVITAWLHRGTTAMAMDETSKVDPTSFDLGWTDEDSGAYEQATSGLVAPFNLLGLPRRGGVHPDAAPGIPSKGAYI